MTNKEVDFGIQGEKAVLINGDQLGADPATNEVDDLDKLARDLDIEPVGRPSNKVKKDNFDETLPNPD